MKDAGFGATPIFNLESLPLIKEVAFSVEPVAMSAGVVMTWEGDIPISIELNWSITAGFQQAIPTRKALYDYVKKVQSWAAPSGTTGTTGDEGFLLLLPPPKITLFIPGYIEADGIVKRAACTPKGPWDVSGSSPRYPTSSDFSVTFLPIKNYVVDENVVNMADAARLSNDINEKFYRS